MSTEAAGASGPAGTAARERGAAAALRSLWSLSLGVGSGALCATAVNRSPPQGLVWALILLGLAAAVRAMARPRGRRALIWLLAGLAIGGGRGLQGRADRLALESAFQRSQALVARVTATVREGWSRSRWGWRTTVTVHSAVAAGQPIPLAGHPMLEVRGGGEGTDLPPPGSRLAVLVTPRLESGRRPLLVASSPRVLVADDAPEGLHAVRHALVHRLLAVAGTHARRIRTAELAASLALGRRDLLSPLRRERWRRSGLAHVLAVSGLHVGLVGALVWLSAVAAGSGPAVSRVAVMAALPTYALLAGASPSALRAALMGSVYLGARLLGRPILPMASILLAALVMLLAAPALVRDPGFQLTVVITLALVRWCPVVSTWLRGPRWLAGAVAVPLVAQLAAVPLVAMHFRSLIPGAMLANLAALPLLAPTLILSLGATGLAIVSSSAATVALDLLSVCEGALMVCGTPARAAAAATPTLPALATIALVVTGAAALWPGPRARIAAAAWCTVLVALVGGQICRPGPAPGRLELLPVADGMAGLAGTTAGAVLIDGGSFRRQAADLLADAGVHRLAAVVASHGDSDHVGGLPDVFRRLGVQTLITPAWMLQGPDGEALVRDARLRGIRVLPVARGLAVSLGDSRLEVLWPPALDPPREDNERSLVARLTRPGGSAIITSDIGATTERELVSSVRLRCGLLVVAHHGSRHSSSPGFLDAASPDVALIPAGPLNLNHHPHPEVVARLEARHIPSRSPARDGWCGAELRNGRWRLFP